MPRLIDADELYVDARCGENEEPYISLYQINDAPTVDAEPVVRCKDCKYSDWWGPQGKEVLDCTRLDVPHTTPDWYCAWGERKE